MFDSSELRPRVSERSTVGHHCVGNDACHGNLESGVGVNVTHARGVRRKVCKKTTELAVIEGVKPGRASCEMTVRVNQ